jgi:Na+/glutamate symporter
MREGRGENNNSFGNQTVVNRRVVNQTVVNQTMVKQTVVIKTEVQPMTYINKTIEKRSLPDYFMSAIAGVIGGIISGFVIATILIRRQKPEVIYMKNVEPPEELRDRMMDVRRLQSQDSEAETATGDSGEDRR